MLDSNPSSRTKKLSIETWKNWANFSKVSALGFCVPLNRSLRLLFLLLHRYSAKSDDLYGELSSISFTFLPLNIAPSKNYSEDSEGNFVYDTPVCHLLKLVSINQVFVSDLGLYNLNRSARYTLSMLSEDSMRFLVQGVSDFSWGDNPKDSVITKVNNLEISCIKGFLNNTDEGSVGKEPGEDNDTPSTSDPSEEKGIY